MYLKKVSVKNYSRLADLDIDIRGHAVIVGANDVGKTSLLRILHMLLGASTAQIFQSLTPGDLRDPDKTLEVEVLLAGLGPDEWTVMPHEPSISRHRSVGDAADPARCRHRSWRPGSNHGAPLVPRLRPRPGHHA